MRKIGWGLAVLFLLVLGAILLFQKQIGLALFERAVAQTIMRDNLAGLEDGLHLGLCGTGSPLPNAERAGPCNVVIAGQQRFVVDIGDGANEMLTLMGINVAQLDAALLTHYHSDHIDGLGQLMLFHWTRGASKAPLPVYGPEGLETIVDGFNQAYAIDNGYRIAHHGEGIVPASGGGAEARMFALDGDSGVVFERDGLKITAFSVDHSPVHPAVGYRFDYKGRALCLSGDSAQTPTLEAACKGVDILVHDALQPAMVDIMRKAAAESGNANAAQIFIDIQDYHASPEQAAASAQKTGAKLLVLSHLVPPLPLRYLYPAFLNDAGDHFDGEIIVGEDGMFFSLPAQEQSIEHARLF